MVDRNSRNSASADAISVKRDFGTSDGTVVVRSVRSMPYHRRSISSDGESFFVGLAAMVFLKISQYCGSARVRCSTQSRMFHAVGFGRNRSCAGERFATSSTSQLSVISR